MTTEVVLTAVLVAVTAEVPRVLVVRRPGLDKAADAPGWPAGALAAADEDALPFGPFEPARHRTLELGLRARVAEQTGLDVRYVEQLYTFGDRYRDPRECAGAPRVLAVAYLALTQERPPLGADARWRDAYAFLPWEDWRDGRPSLLDSTIRPVLRRWQAAPADIAERRRREERVDICFGFGSAPWDPVRVLERYELLYETGLAAEATRDTMLRGHACQPCAPSAAAPRLHPPLCSEANMSEPPSMTTGAPMALDDRRILATALGRLRGKLAWRPVVFDLLPGEFTLFALQRLVEALTGQRLHKQNFRRMLAASALLEPTGRLEHTGRGRPAELYRFRREVLRAKAAAGVALPAPRTGG